jgi:hypothetical protein
MLLRGDAVSKQQPPIREDRGLARHLGRSIYREEQPTSHLISVVPQQCRYTARRRYRRRLASSVRNLAGSARNLAWASGSLSPPRLRTKTKPG